MIIFKSFAFVVSVFIYEILGIVDEHFDLLTKILLFQNIYHIILFFTFAVYFVFYKKIIAKKIY